MAVTAVTAADFRVEPGVIATSPPEHYLTQSRGALIPGNPARVIVTTQETETKGAHGYRDLFDLESTDAGRTWTKPVRIESLRRTRMPEGHDFVIGDVCPQWHAATGLVLATGKTFGFRGGTTEDRGFEKVSYAIYTPTTRQWTTLKVLALPKTDHGGNLILEPNSGCHQRVDLPNGDILLPIRYRKDPKTRFYTTIVARCTFDGATLAYREHGSEFTIPRERGLYEPSVTAFQGRTFLTMRADHSAFVARSTDGINFEPFIEWRFDDGGVLGSYNTQQHWIARHDTLYLVYTRRGANNDHVMRHRAPLFVARVDPERLCVERATEQILIPEAGGADLGNFGVMDFSPDETWVITSESPPAANNGGPNRVLLAKLIWNTPNKAFQSAPTHRK
ncbi:MAG: exo-alpha-sialidase [Opitutus sp.]|nr:exo-alpha-sialidase [Opitutus sp.]